MEFQALGAVVVMKYKNAVVYKNRYRNDYKNIKWVHSFSVIFEICSCSNEIICIFEPENRS